MKEIQDLIQISRYFGVKKDYTLAGGGNTSYKNREFIWIKASGASLASITEDGFAKLYREKVKVVGKKDYSKDAQQREVQVKEDLIAANVFPEKGKRPSVETSFHELIEYAYVVHMHPTLTNALMCARNSKSETLRLFGKVAMYITYAPGYPLFMKVKKEIVGYRKKYNTDPKIIFLENHGVFVSADTIKEIKEIYAYITNTIRNNISHFQAFDDLEIEDEIVQFVPYIRMKLSSSGVKSVNHRHNTLHAHFYKSRDEFQKISGPFTPDIIVYCKAAYLYIEDSNSPQSIITSFERLLPEFISTYGYEPKVILIKNYGLFAVEDTAGSAEITMDVFEDLMKVSLYTEAFGGPRFLSRDEISFVDNWEVENYRRKISKGLEGNSVVEQKVAIVTGAAQGFGEGIAEDLLKKGANVVVADLNNKKGKETILKLNKFCKKNRVIFHKADVSDPDSIRNAIKETVSQFGGLDILISNAGILHAGAIDEMSPELFIKMTEVNYYAWFYCVKAASSAMKLQREAKPDYTMDLIQINSKSGLEGSNRNFAYSGAKFGGIGLTQSFALELASFGIKVNAVCPGNYFEGPLWSDTEKGLLVQYLSAGKVPGAKTVEDVKAFYESKVPISRGCRVEDLMKAIYYIIDQQYETGQALPVTGGQVMLN